MSPIQEHFQEALILEHCVAARTLYRVRPVPRLHSSLVFDLEATILHSSLLSEESRSAMAKIGHAIDIDKPSTLVCICKTDSVKFFL